MWLEFSAVLLVIVGVFVLASIPQSKTNVVRPKAPRVTRGLRIVIVRERPESFIGDSLMARIRSSWGTDEGGV